MDARAVGIAGMLIVMLVTGCGSHGAPGSTLLAGGTVHFTFVDKAGAPVTQVHYEVNDTAGHVTAGITPAADITLPDLVGGYSLYATKAGFHDAPVTGTLLPGQALNVTVTMFAYAWPTFATTPAQMTSSAGWTAFSPWTQAVCDNQETGIYFAMRCSATADASGRYTTEWYFANGYAQPATFTYTLFDTQLGNSTTATVTLPAMGSTGGAAAGMTAVLDGEPKNSQLLINALTVGGIALYAGN